MTSFISFTCYQWQAERIKSYAKAHGYESTNDWLRRVICKEIGIDADAVWPADLIKGRSNG